MRSNKLITAVLFGIIFPLSFLPQKTYAQWNADPMLNTPICTTSGTHQFQPQLAADGAGGAYFAWMESPDFNSSQIYAQHVSANGERLWPLAGLPITPVPGLYSQVQVVATSDGGAIISWINTANAAIKHYVQKISASGELLWNSNGVAVCPSELTQVFFYQLLTDGNDGAILLWDDQRGGSNSVFGQRISASGNLLWSAAGILCAPAFTNMSSYDAVSDSSGGIYLCWTITTGINTRNDVFAQHIDGLGTAQWGVPGINISNALSDQLYCKIAKDARQNIIVAWQDFRLDPARSQIFGQRISKQGGLLWDSGGLKIADSVVAAGTVLKLATDTAAGVQMAWIDRFLPAPSKTAHLFSERIDSAGAVISAKKEIATWADLQMPVDFKWLPDYRGGAFAGWAQTNVANPTGAAGEHYDIYAQHLMADGSIEYALPGKAVSTASLNQYYLQMIADSNAAAILTWSDLRSGTDYDLYASLLAVQNSLPVTWLDFTGHLSGGSVLLKWATASEINNLGFGIQRSADGTRFDNIGFVSAHGMNVAAADYNFSDSRPLKGPGFYRLRQIDLDGKSSYSHTIKIQNDPVAKLSVSPNPASGQLLIQGDINNATITLYSIQGQKIKHFQTNSSQALYLDVSTLQRGTYFLLVDQSEKNSVSQISFVKQ